ncbi:MAG: hypothetical protein SGI77_10060 [Pirellulaceae bacterium]|nr:hypothetical protein [Pirellulaceae bacterium]
MPDWIRVVDKRTRARSKTITNFLDLNTNACSPNTHSLCLGILQHHKDDDWFHNSDAFLTLNARFTRQLQEAMGNDASMRAGFVGHISIELLLDAALIENSPAELATYYRVLDSLDHAAIETSLGQILGRPIERVAKLIRRFSIERFMYDYLEDARLLRRLNQVMARVGLAALPDSILDWLPLARQNVYQECDALLAQPQSL